MTITHLLKRFIHDLRAELDEAAFTIPVLLLLTFGITNFGMLGYANAVAANAANIGARMGSVAQSDAPQVARKAAMQQLDSAADFDYAVSVTGGGAPGATIRVAVSYRIPNVYAPLAAFFGVESSDFDGTVTADFRQEGW